MFSYGAVVSFGLMFSYILQEEHRAIFICPDFDDIGLQFTYLPNKYGTGEGILDD